MFSSSFSSLSFPFSPNKPSSSPSSSSLSPSLSSSSSNYIRGVKWIYLGIIITSPSIHIIVSYYRKYPQYSKVLLGTIIGTTLTAVITRIYFFYESGFMFEAFPKWIQK